MSVIFGDIWLYRSDHMIGIYDYVIQRYDPKDHRLYLNDAHYLSFKENLTESLYKLWPYKQPDEIPPDGPRQIALAMSVDDEKDQNVVIHYWLPDGEQYHYMKFMESTKKLITGLHDRLQTKQRLIPLSFGEWNLAGLTVSMGEGTILFFEKIIPPRSEPLYLCQNKHKEKNLYLSKSQCDKVPLDTFNTINFGLALYRTLYLFSIEHDTYYFLNRELINGQLGKEYPIKNGRGKVSEFFDCSGRRMPENLMVDKKEINLDDIVNQPNNGNGGGTIFLYEYRPRKIQSVSPILRNLLINFVIMKYLVMIIVYLIVTYKIFMGDVESVHGFAGAVGGFSTMISNLSTRLSGTTASVTGISERRSSKMNQSKKASSKKSKSKK